MFFKISVLKYFAIFTGKHLHWSLFLVRLQSWRPATLFKRDSNTGVSLWILRSVQEYLFRGAPPVATFAVLKNSPGKRQWRRLNRSIFLRLRVTQNALQLLFFPFFVSFFLALFLDGLSKAFCGCLIFRYPRHVWPVPGLFPRTHWEIFLSMFCLLLFQAWVASTCLISMKNFFGGCFACLMKLQFNVWIVLLLKVIYSYLIL